MAVAVLEKVRTELREEFEKAGKADQFRFLSPFLTGEEPPSYAEVAPNIGLSEAAARVAVHRLKQRYGRLLREELSRTVSSSKELDDEIRFLQRVLGE
jgi:RNA polymerase sigma-70 factor (ECF subfamily)